MHSHSLSLHASLGNLAKVKEFLNAGVYIEEVDHDGDTALMNAAQYGHLEVVQHLVEEKARFSLNGRSSLINAAQAPTAEVFQYLIAAGADLELSFMQVVQYSIALNTSASNAILADVLNDTPEQLWKKPKVLDKFHELLQSSMASSNALAFKMLIKLIEPAELPVQLGRFLREMPNILSKIASTDPQIAALLYSLSFPNKNYWTVQRKQQLSRHLTAPENDASDVLKALISVGFTSGYLSSANILADICKPGYANEALQLLRVILPRLITKYDDKADSRILASLHGLPANCFTLQIFKEFIAHGFSPEQLLRQHIATAKVHKSFITGMQVLMSTADGARLYDCHAKKPSVTNSAIHKLATECKKASSGLAVLVAAGSLSSITVTQLEKLTNITLLGRACKKASQKSIIQQL